MNPINLGGTYLKLHVDGVDEQLEKLNELSQKLKEANTLIREIASVELEMKFKTDESSPLEDG